MKLNTIWFLFGVRTLNIKVSSLLMTRQCLSRRIFTIDKLKSGLSAWEAERNQDTAKIQWHFQIGNAREKLISLYPVIPSVTSK